ncbi:hypothetical protein AVV36_gp189 [Pectobacterium bacteriophage PM2]|uniref:Uncharacterized protein n=1 Tax=Pectobacterium bacteriophage PM2 TaxID=1429794 RepID=A0A0A0Q0Q9_9CAUD|nr:hypothetical protein AVV36_gp189 [Pectobacterium bacteriophage PM2]AHY25221.1 hypothetical protein PM2_259 [Pectobacterium bacteriophage PM2]
MKRKIIELKEFEYKTQHQLKLMMKSEAYSGVLIIADYYGKIHQAELCQFENGKILFIREDDDIDNGICPSSVTFIEDKGLL